MKIIDFHAHPFLNAAQDFSFYKGVTPQGALAMKRQLQDMGVSHICGSVIAADRSFDLRALNDAALSLRDVLGADFYTPGFHIHPGQMQLSFAEIERMHKENARLIGELVPYMHGWNDFAQWPCVDEMNALMDVAEGYRMVFSYHILWDWPLEPVIAAHPAMPFIAAHPGQQDSVARHIARMRKYPNAYLDLSGTGIMRYGCTRHLIEQVGADRILFGTDYPISNPIPYIAAVENEGIAQADLHKLFHENAERLLGL